MKKIRVGLITSVIDNRKGRGTALVARKILNEMHHFTNETDFTLIHASHNDDPLYTQFPDIVMRPSPLPFAKQFLQETLFWITYRLTRGSFDVVHYLHHRIWPSYLLAYGRRIIITIYDAGIMLDLNRPSMGDRVFRFTNRYLHQRMHVIITSSEFGKQEIAHYYRVPKERIHVVPLGVDPIFKPIEVTETARETLREYGIEGPYILSVSRFDPHKNILRLVEAYELARKNGVTATLVMVGGRHMKDYSEKVDALIRDLHLESFIYIAPFIPDEAMPLVYSAAEMLIYPSLHEGFGLPIAEAFACGTPVATSNTTACPETAGDAALLFDPEDITAIADAITSVSTDESLRATLRAKGLIRAKEFSWQKVAEENCTLYKQIALVK
jgi:glycosyltransferase involved in cell wall biosynthesis